MSAGLVLSIERGSLHDGPGIRTTVFLKGCSLHCLWCHNPESISRSAELFFLQERCARCRACACACPHGCHTFTAGGHAVDRTTCRACGRCGLVCPAGALEVKGRVMEAGEVMEEVLKDRIYYDESGGGLTVSGGEPMAQREFTAALLGRAREAGVHTCLETSGAAPAHAYREIAPAVSLFIIDWKESDPEKHRRWTGAGNTLIRAAFTALDRAGAPMLMRCPIVPGCNDRPDHFDGIAALANSLSRLQGIEVMPYHPLGAAKSERLGTAYPFDNREFTADATAEGWREAIRRRTSLPVR